MMKNNGSSTEPWGILRMNLNQSLWEDPTLVLCLEFAKYFFHKKRLAMSNTYTSDLAISRSGARQSYALDKSISILPTNPHWSSFSAKPGVI